MKFNISEIMNYYRENIILKERKENILLKNKWHMHLNINKNDVRIKK